jgi:hypothetical protein
MGSGASPFIVDDAIVCLAQPPTEPLDQLANGPRRACDLIEELGRREDFYLDLAGGSSGRIARAVFDNAHLPYELPGTNRAEKDRVALEFPDYVNGTAKEAKNTVGRITLFESTCPLANCARFIVVPVVRWRTQKGEAVTDYPRVGFPALWLHATALTPSQGRLIRCTVPGSTPNRLAILRTPFGE